MNKILMIICVTLFNSCILEKLPSNFKKCDRERDINTCLKLAVQDAIKQLKQPVSDLDLPSSEPLDVGDFTIRPGSDLINFKQEYYDMKIFGFTNCTIESLEYKDTSLNFMCFIPNLLIIFNYHYDGDILGLKFKGEGPGQVNYINFTYSFTFFLKEYEKDGQKYFNVTSNDTKFKPGKLKFDFKNIFPISTDDIPGGQALEGIGSQLSKKIPGLPAGGINEVFNNLGLEIFEDVGQNYEMFVGSLFAGIFNSLLEKVPVCELFEN